MVNMPWSVVWLWRSLPLEVIKSNLHATKMMVFSLNDRSQISSNDSNWPTVTVKLVDKVMQQYWTEHSRRPGWQDERGSEFVMMIIKQSCQWWSSSLHHLHQWTKQNILGVNSVIWFQTPVLVHSSPTLLQIANLLLHSSPQPREIRTRILGGSATEGSVVSVHPSVCPVRLRSKYHTTCNPYMQNGHSSCSKVLFFYIHGFCCKSCTSVTAVDNSVSTYTLLSIGPLL